MTQRIEVRSTTQRIDVNPLTSRVEVRSPVNRVAVVQAGPQGPPGPPGPVGNSFMHTQVAESTSWVINHNLGYYPNVTAFDVLGRVIEATEIHHSTNQLELQLLTPRAGVARLS